MPEPTALYRLYDVDDRLLYVGISSNPEKRWRQHALFNARTWWPQVTRKEVEWLETRAEAEEVELEAIRAEKPIYNLRDIPSPLILANIDRVANAFKGPGHAPYSYANIAFVLLEAIERGDLSPGDRLPGVVETGKYFGIGVPTVQRAHQLLKDEGIIEGRKGAGVFVAKPENRLASIPVGRPHAVGQALAEHMTHEGLATVLQDLLQRLDSTGIPSSDPESSDASVKRSEDPPPAMATPLLKHQITDRVRCLIRDDGYQPGDRIPGENQLMQEYGVSRVTIRAALAALRDEGLIEARVGSGVFVRPVESVTVPLDDPARTAAALRQILTPAVRRSLAALLAEEG